MPDDPADEQTSSENNPLSSLLSKEFLIPALVSAGAAVVAQRGPQLLKGLASGAESKGKEEARELGAEGAEAAKGALAGAGPLGKLASAVLPGGGSGRKKTRRLPIQRWTDVAAPVDRVYREWSQFEDFPKFMHRVLSVNQDDRTVRWEEKIWFSKRQWESEITDRRKNDRIAWKTKSGMQHAGVVSFHQLAPNLTRVMVTIDFVPSGMVEKMASGMRFVKRAVQADLARFKAHVEMGAAKGLEYRSEAQTEDSEEGGAEDDRDSEPSDSGGQQSSHDDGRREREEHRRERRETIGAR